MWRPRTLPRSGLVCAALLIAFSCSQLNYTRPGLPKLNPRLLENWKNEVKEKGRINCPNNVRTVSVFLQASWSECAGGGRRFGGRNPPKPGSCWAPDGAGSDAQTPISPPLPGVAAVPGQSMSHLWDPPSVLKPPGSPGSPGATLSAGTLGLLVQHCLIWALELPSGSSQDPDRAKAARSVLESLLMQRTSVSQHKARAGFKPFLKPWDWQGPRGRAVCASSCCERQPWPELVGR